MIGATGLGRHFYSQCGFRIGLARMILIWRLSASAHRKYSLGSSSIPDIIRIRQGSWKGYLGSDQELLDINFLHHFLPPVFAPRLLGEIVCITNEICLYLIDSHFTSVDISSNLSELAA